MSLNARRHQRVQKPVSPETNLNGQATFSRGYVPQKKPPEPSRFAMEFEVALIQRGQLAKATRTSIIQIDPVNVTISKRQNRRIRSAEHRLERAQYKAAKATLKASLAHGDALKEYTKSSDKAKVKVTYRMLQLAGKSQQARKLAKEHQL